MHEFGLCTVEHTDFELFQSSFVYGCVNCVVVCKDFENFKAFQCWSLWQSVLWDVKTLKCKFSNVGDIVVTVMWYVQTLKLFSFLVWGLCVVACKHVENFKVPCVCGSISY